MNVTQDTDLIIETIELIKKLSHMDSMIGIYIDHNYEAIIESQIILSNSDYSIYKETFKKEDTITSQLLNAGAKHVYYVVPKTNNYRQAYIHIIDLLGYNYPITCVASGLAFDIDPAVIVEFNKENLKQFPDRMHVSELKEKEISFEGRNFIIE